MNDKSTYKSFSVKLFDTFRVIIYGYVLVCILLSFILRDARLAFIVAGILITVIVAIQVGYSYSIVTKEGNSIQLQNIDKTVQVKHVEKVKTWWCYEFGGSLIVMGEGTQGKTRASSNKINCYVKFEGNGEAAYIYEQIHLGGKFPNGHVYSIDEKVDKSKTIRVWDVDKCLSKLNITQNEINAKT